jgi:DUF1680 family protein
MKPSRLILSFLALLAAVPVCAQQSPAGLAKPGTQRVADAMTLPVPKNVKLGGLLGDRFNKNESVRLLNVDEEELLAGFRHRPGKQAWIGEHVGKWLHAASLAYANTGDPALRTKLDRVVRELLITQESNGYLGTYVPEKRWGLFPDADWDVWVHKYDLLGLLAYYQFTGNKEALAGASRVGDLLCNTFGPGKKSIISAGTHVGMAATSVLEPVVLLYRATGEPRYLDFAKYIVTAWDEPNGPHIISSLMKYKSVRKTANAKAYEMLSNLNGLCELYRATGNKEYLDAVLIAWQDIVDHRLYITGSGSAGEHWQDEGHLPNGPGANICETCVTVTWEQLNIQLLRLLGKGRFADQLERSIYNHLLAAQRPGGEAWCYYTPLEGTKPYGSSTNCCLSSGPRGVALLPDFAYSEGSDGPSVNLYSDGKATLNVGRGTVSIAQSTAYPLGRDVLLTIHPRQVRDFTIQLRIPQWAGNLDELKVNGKPRTQIEAEHGYVFLKRRWADGDRIRFRFREASLTLTGQGESEGRLAFSAGPLVLAVDEKHNPGLKPLQRVELVSDPKLSRLSRGTDADEQVWETDCLFLAPGATERRASKLKLVPYYAAGADGSRFEVWIRRSGSAEKTGSSLFYLAEESHSRVGNQGGEVTDDDPSTFRVTFDSTKKDLDWYSVSLPTPVRINRIVFAHGHCFHDGGWFDTSSGKPRVQVKKSKDGNWDEAGLLESYPDTSDVKPGRGLRDGALFTLRVSPVEVFGVRIVGKPACGDNPRQSFSSCAELQAFYDK